MTNSVMSWEKNCCNFLLYLLLQQHRYALGRFSIFINKASFTFVLFCIS
jgi:hypothetical protein